MCSELRSYGSEYFPNIWATVRKWAERIGDGIKGSEAQFRHLEIHQNRKSRLFDFGKMEPIISSGKNGLIHYRWKRTDIPPKTPNLRVCRIAFRVLEWAHPLPNYCTWLRMQSVACCCVHRSSAFKFRGALLPTGGAVGAPAADAGAAILGGGGSSSFGITFWEIGKTKNIRNQGI